MGKKGFSSKRAASAALLILVLFFLQAPTSLFAGPLEKLTELMEDAHYSRSDIALVRDAFSNGLARGIPEELLLVSPSQGSAKGVPAEKIAGAVENDIEELHRVRTLFLSVPGGDAFLQRHGDWQRTSLMLSAGFAWEELKALMVLSASKPTIFRPLSYLYAALSQWGLEPDMLERLCAALSVSPIPPRDFAAVTELYRSASRERISPEELTDRIIRHAPEVESFRELSRRVLY